MIFARSSLVGAVAVSSAALSAALFAATGDPLPDVDVSLERKPGRLIRQVRTDPQGNFSFGFVQEGDYVIRVTPSPAPAPRHASIDANPVAPGSTTKSFFESRSNTVRTDGTSPMRYQVIVNGASPGSERRASGNDGNRELHVTTSGGQLGGRVISQ